MPTVLRAPADLISINTSTVVSKGEIVREVFFLPTIKGSFGSREIQRELNRDEQGGNIDGSFLCSFELPQLSSSAKAAETYTQVQSRSPARRKAETRREWRRDKL